MFQNAYTLGAGPDSVVTYYRFLIPRLLSKYDRVIYVDIDYVFRSGLGDLYFHENMEGYYLAGVRDLGISRLYKDYMLNMGINPDKYINAGFLLMNLKLINQDGIVDQWLREVSNEQVQRLFMDQDILNLICGDKIKFLRAKYNSVALGDKDLFAMDEYEEAVREGNIHYAGGPKPWQGWRGLLWWKYYFRLPLSQMEMKFFINSWYAIVYRFVRSIVSRIVHYFK